MIAEYRPRSVRIAPKWLHRQRGERTRGRPLGNIQKGPWDSRLERVAAAIRVLLEGYAARGTSQDARALVIHPELNVQDRLATRCEIPHRKVSYPIASRVRGLGTLGVVGGRLQRPAQRRIAREAHLQGVAGPSDVGLDQGIMAIHERSVVDDMRADVKRLAVVHEGKACREPRLQSLLVYA